LFKNVGKEVVRTREIDQDLDYIRKHEEITNVLLTGGDPLLLSTNKLKSIIETINEIDHIKIIRIGTKTPAFNPFRIISDDTLSSFIKKIANSGKKLYFIVHFNHPRELTSASIQGINILQNSGAIIANQTPLLHGINDNPKILSTLFKKLSFNGIPPYYVFQNRPVMGNKGFTIPLEKAYSIFLESLEDISGLAKRPRFVMSHESGKIEVAALTSKNIIFRYHRSHNPDKYGKFFVFKRDSQAYWLDDYKELVEIYNYKSF
jgi:KamA family protein